MTAIRNASTGQTSAGRKPAGTVCCRQFPTGRRVVPGRVLGVLGGLGVLAALGCGESTITPPSLPPGEAYTALQLNQHAIMLALQPTYDTVQLTATPLSALGTPLTLPGAVTFTSLDTTVVTVSPAGLVTAHGTAPVSSPVKVAAAWQDVAQGVTHVDTARIAVALTVPAAIDTFSMQPVRGDSAKRALQYYFQPGFDWPVHAVSATGSLLCSSQGCDSLLVAYASSRPLIATIDPLTGHVMGLDTGKVVFTAQTMAYHQVLRDAVQFRIGYINWVWVWGFLTLVLGVLTVGFLAPKKLILGVGATIVFCNNGYNPIAGGYLYVNHPIDVGFDHPEVVDTASCGVPAYGTYLPPTNESGNIAPFGGDTTTDPNTGALPFSDIACRRFSVPGVYHYHSTLFPSDTYEIDIRPDPQ